jgi:hypothetical protein
MQNELAVVVRIADRLAHDQPRNLDVLHLCHQVHQLARAAAVETSTSGISVGKRKRDWARIKRAQRARARAAISESDRSKSESLSPTTKPDMP